MKLSLPREYVAIILLSLVVGLTLFRPWVHGIDGTGYYSWLRSGVIDGDLETADEFQHFDRIERDWSDPFRAASTGLHANPYPIGPAILWSPAFLLAHLVAPLFGYVADGYSPPYIWAISFTSVLMVSVALALLLRLARRWAASGPALWGIVAVWLGSPLVFYQYAHPSMSHAADVFMNSLVVWWWVCSAARFGGLRSCFALGMLIGGAALVRPQNMLLLLLPGAWLLGLAFRRRRGYAEWVRACAGVCMLGFGALLLFAPQLWVWWRVFGSPFVNVQAIAYRAPLHVDLLRPHLLEVLFSSNRGLFTWSPILLPATLAWPVLWRYDRPAAALALANAAVQVYLIASWPTWWGGAAFGARLLLGVFPLWALGLVAGFEWLRRRGLPVFAMAGAAGAFTCWNALLLAQYALGLVARNGPTDLGAMVRNQWTVIARLVGRLSLY